MPTVPDYSIPTVDYAATPQVRFDAPAMPDVAGKQTRAMGDALLKTGNVVTRIADKIQSDKDDAFTKEMDNQLSDKLRIALHDKDVGYLTKVGKNAVTGYEDTVKGIKTIREDIEAGLENDMQRAMFRKVSNAREQSALMQIDTHAAHQTKVWNEGETVSRVKAASSDAVANSAGWNTSGSMYDVAKKTLVGEVDDLANLRGYDTAARDQLKAEALAGMHSSVLQNMVAGDSNRIQDARKYLEANEKDISRGAPDQLDNLKNLVKQAGVKEQSIELAHTLKGGLNEQIKALDKMVDSKQITPEVYDNARQRVEHNWQMRKAQQAEGEKNVLGAGIDWVLKNQGKTVLDMPDALYNSLKNHGASLATVVGFAKSNGKPDTDETIYYGLRQMASEEPQKFAELDLLKSRDKLAPSDWNRLVELQSGINKNDAKAMQMEKTLGSAIKTIKADIASAGIDLTPKEGSKQAAETSKFMNTLYATLDEAQQKKGAALTPKESRDIGLSMLKQGWIQGTGIFFDDKKRGYQLGSEDKAKFVTVRYGDIPATTRDQIRADLQGGNQGRVVTNSEIERVYQRALDAGRVK